MKVQPHFGLKPIATVPVQFVDPKQKHSGFIPATVWEVEDKDVPAMTRIFLQWGPSGARLTSLAGALYQLTYKTPEQVLDSLKSHPLADFFKTMVRGPHGMGLPVPAIFSKKPKGYSPERQLLTNVVMTVGDSPEGKPGKLIGYINLVNTKPKGVFLPPHPLAPLMGTHVGALEVAPWSRKKGGPQFVGVAEQLAMAALEPLKTQKVSFIPADWTPEASVLTRRIQQVVGPVQSVGPLKVISARQLAHGFHKRQVKHPQILYAQAVAQASQAYLKTVSQATTF